VNLSLFIARKYFLSRKKKSFINVISLISMLVVGMGTMALIIVLSVFNGLEGLLRELYGNFDPALQITAKEGKSFTYDRQLEQQLTETEGVELITEVIEDNVLLKYKNAQRVVRMKGVSEHFMRQDRLNQSIVYGEPRLRMGQVNYAIIGRGIQYDLSINPENDFYTLQVYYPRDIGPGVVDPTRLYRAQNILPGGVFAIEKYYDENYFFVPLSFAQNLLQYGDRRTALELSTTADVNLKTLKNELQTKLGDQFVVRLGEELHEDLYKILKIEKLFVFLIFSLVIGIASINIYFSLTMLALDKKRDLSILSAQGASNRLIRNIFLAEGAIVAFTGAITGLVLGLTISFLQQHFGFISMGMQTTVMDAYPVKVEAFDVMISCVCILVITLLASLQPAKLAVKNISLTNL
jgi:lipoprotein-releasing system permease protein